MRWTAVTVVLVLLGLVLTGCAVWLIAKAADSVGFFSPRTWCSGS